MEHEVPLAGRSLILVDLAQGQLDAAQPAGNPVILRVQPAGFGKVLLRQDRMVGNSGVRLRLAEPLRDRPEVRMGQEQADLRLAGILQIGGGQQSNGLGRLRIVSRVQRSPERLCGLLRERGLSWVRRFLRCEADGEVVTSRAHQE